MECPNCGKELLEGSRFCSWCGRDLAPVTIEPQAEVPAAAPSPVVQVVARPRPHPWIRYFARSFDFALAVVTFLVATKLSNVPLERPAAYFMGMLVYGVYFAIESVLIWRIGTTPGKALFHVSVESAIGGAPSFQQSWRRSLGVYVRGVAFGIPLIMPVAQLFSYFQLIRDGQTSWDRDFHCRVTHGTISTVRAVVIVFCFLVLVAILGAVLLGDGSAAALAGDV
jgi:hypothetical protein